MGVSALMPWPDDSLSVDVHGRTVIMECSICWKGMGEKVVEEEEEAWKSPAEDFIP